MSTPPALAPQPVEVPRDRWGRPEIVPPSGGPAVPYTRVSTLAKSLDDTSNLMSWKQRVTAVGLAKRRDLLTGVSGLLASGADPVSDWPAKRDLNRLCKDAAEAGGSSTAATTGTGWHSFTEALDRGMALADIFADEDTLTRLAQYQAATTHLEVLDIETFVVNDTLKTAGTFDRLVRLPDGRVVVADLKTGKSDADYPLSVTVQIATYAMGKRYDPATGQRNLLHADLDPTVGLLIHLPQKGDGCRVYELDLTAGWEAAQVAAQVHRIRKIKADELRKELT